MKMEFNPQHMKIFKVTSQIIMTFWGVQKWHSYRICLFSNKCLATAYEIRFSYFQCFKVGFWTPTNILGTMMNLLGLPVFLRLTSIKLGKKWPILLKFCPKRQISACFCKKKYFRGNVTQTYIHVQIFPRNNSK